MSSQWGQAIATSRGFIYNVSACFDQTVESALNAHMFQALSKQCVFKRRNE